MRPTPLDLAELDDNTFAGLDNLVSMPAVSPLTDQEFQIVSSPDGVHLLHAFQQRPAVSTSRGPTVQLVLSICDGKLRTGPGATHPGIRVVPTTASRSRG